MSPLHKYPVFTSLASGSMQVSHSIPSRKQGQVLMIIFDPFLSLIIFWSAFGLIFIIVLWNAGTIAARIGCASHIATLGWLGSGAWLVVMAFIENTDCAIWFWVLFPFICIRP